MDTGNTENLPAVAKTFIDVVIKKMRYRKKVRSEVRRELTDHFIDALRTCQTDKEKTSHAEEMITDFGDPKILAILIRRGKKRNRPLWKKAIIRPLQALGIFIVLFFLYSLWFISGKPVISTDYVTVLNKMSKPDIMEGQNAWTDYNKAIAAYIKPEGKVKEITDELKATKIKDRLDKLTDEQKEIFTAWLDSNKPAWDHFVAGSKKPYAYREYGYEDGSEPEDRWLIAIMLPHLKEIRDISRLGAWHAVIDADRGDIQQALERSLALIKTGKHLKNHFILIEQLVGSAIEAIGSKAITEIISEKQVPAALLDKLNDELTSVYSTGYPMSNMDGERLFFHDCVQQIYTAGGPGGGHVIPDRLVFLTHDIGQTEDDIIERMLAVPACIIHAGRNDIIKKGNELYDHLNTLTKYTPYQKRKNKIKRTEDFLEELSFRYSLIKTLLPAIEKVIALNYRAKAQYESLLTILAVLRYQNQTGDLPDDLGQLVQAGYLASLPDDPYGPGPLAYKKTGSTFTLYSLSNNFTDDGGKQGTNDEGEKTKWPENGDMLFWPTE